MYYTRVCVCELPLQHRFRYIMCYVAAAVHTITWLIAHIGHPASSLSAHAQSFIITIRLQSKIEWENEMKKIKKKAE